MRSLMSIAGLVVMIAVIIITRCNMTQIKGDGFVLQHISHGEYQLVFSIEADPNEIDAAIDHVFKTEVK